MIDADYSIDDLIALEGDHGSGAVPRRPPVLVRGDGCTLYDREGREFIDMGSAQGWANFGHGHPEIVDAIRHQAATLTCVTESAHTEIRALWFRDLAGLLSIAFPATARGGLTRIVPTSSGAEAVEAGLKAARYFTGRPGIVACRRAFHGRTFGALSATAGSHYREPFKPLVPGFRHVAFNDSAAMDEAVGDETAAVIVEIVQGEGGVHVADAEFLQSLRARCDERGALLIVDEIQTGIGRTGRPFAAQHFDLAPDILLLGKALGGGMPMGAAVWRAELGGLPAGTHGSTFAGGPLACAASRAALRVLIRDELCDRAAESGAYLRDRLLAMNAPAAREVRGLGLMCGVQLRSKVGPVLRALLGRGVWALPAGTTVLRLMPPLTIDRPALDTALDRVAGVLADA